MTEEKILLEESILPFKKQSSFDSEGDYLNHVLDNIINSRELGMPIRKDDPQGREPRPRILMLNQMQISPVHKIEMLFKDNAILSKDHIKEIHEHVLNIKKIKQSMGQRKSASDKLNFYDCWVLYELGAPVSEIFEITDKENAWDGAKDNVMRKIKRWAKNYKWKKNSLTNPEIDSKWTVGKPGVHPSEYFDLEE